ncbi:MAG: diaminopimelate epimerase [Desulfovibrionaceae bacterium]|nr:diaminopimelate epimerase [Desulfovibrionaceae bacterium]
MHGCGNDFVFIDNRIARVPEEDMAHWARAVCRPHTGVGADGLVFLELVSAAWKARHGGADSGSESLKRAGRPDAEPDYVWHFYNADGSRAGMCGNASRCAALLSLRLGLAGPEHVLGTDVGLVRASVNQQDSTAEVELPPVRDARPAVSLDVEGRSFDVLHADTGVPHAVIFLHSEAEVEAVDVQRAGAAIRFHPRFAPAGVNVNFAALAAPSVLRLRTYERGVEGETLACGTGAAATAYCAFRQGLTGPDARLVTSGGEILGIRIRDAEDGDRPLLSGRAITVFTGELHLAAVLEAR